MTPTPAPRPTDPNAPAEQHTGISNRETPRQEEAERREHPPVDPGPPPPEDAAGRVGDAETDAERVHRMLDAWRGGGLAVAGPAATLEALQLGQVDELLVSSTPQTIAPETTPEVPMTSELHAVETSDPAAVEAPRLIVADELVTRAEQTGARVRFIEDAALLEPVGGVGALLRFRL